MCYKLSDVWKFYVLVNCYRTCVTASFPDQDYLKKKSKLILLTSIHGACVAVERRVILKIFSTHLNQWLAHINNSWYRVLVFDSITPDKK